LVMRCAPGCARMARGAASRHPMHGQKRPHPRHRHLRIAQQPGVVGQAEQLAEMLDTARRLLPSDHHEVVLVAVQPGHEHHAGPVKGCRCLEDVAPKRGDLATQNDFNACGVEDMAAEIR